MNNFRFKYIFNMNADIDDRLDYIYNTIDDWMKQGKYDKCDKVLEEIYNNHMDMINKHSEIVIAFLFVTVSEKDKIKNRDKFAKEVYNRLLTQGKKIADDLTAGLL